MIAEDPESAAHIICNLPVLLGVIDQQFDEDQEAALVDELLG